MENKNVKIIQLLVRNIKNIKVVELDNLGENPLIQVTGKNASGKSSLIDSIWYALGGQKDIPEMPIHSGQKTAEIEITLSNGLVVSRKITEKGSYLTVTGERGKYATPQKILDELWGNYTFDPLEFLRQDKKDQVGTLLKITNFNPDKKYLESISESNIETDNPIEIINQAFQKIKRDQQEIRKSIDLRKKSIELMGEVEPTEKISVSGLFNDRRKLAEIVSDNNAKRDILKLKKVAYEANEKKLQELNISIEKLQNELSILKDEASRQDKDLSLMSKEISNEFEKIVDLVDPDFTDIDSKINNADSINQKADQWITLQSLRSQLAEDQLIMDSLVEKEKQIVGYKDNLVSNTQFPVSGLGFSSAGVTFNEIPLEQCSTAQKIQIAVSVKIALNPDLRIMRIDDANSLDNDHLEAIKEIAEKNDFQIWAERVDESGEVGIYLECGEVKKIDGTPIKKSIDHEDDSTLF